MAEFFFERLHDALAVAALVHVYEVDDDDAPQIAETNLAHNLFDRINVGFDNRVFEAGGLASILAGVDVNRDQCFSLIDHNVAATLQPDLRLERLVHLLGKAELFEQWRLFRVKLHTLHQRWLKAIEESENALVFRFGINPDHGEI